MSGRTQDFIGVASRGAMLVTRRVPSGGWYIVGYALTRHGVVGVHHEPDYLHLTLIADGAQYERTLRDCGAYTESGIKRHAHGFARDVVAGTLDAKRRGTR